MLYCGIQYVRVLYIYYCHVMIYNGMFRFCSMFYHLSQMYIYIYWLFNYLHIHGLCSLCNVISCHVMYMLYIYIYINLYCFNLNYQSAKRFRVPPWRVCDRGRFYSNFRIVRAWERSYLWINGDESDWSTVRFNGFCCFVGNLDRKPWFLPNKKGHADDAVFGMYG
jgi:hypothetical protein